MKKWINDELNEIISENLPPKETRFYFVLGYPISDLGKGLIAAHLLSFLKKGEIIKFEGVLMTSSKLDREIDDFITYQKYNPKKKFGGKNYLLSGDILIDFEKKYGHRHSTALSPDVVKFFICKLLERFNLLGKPKNLIIEIGGTIHSPENNMYVMTAIEYLKQRLQEKCFLFLLTEMHYRTFPSPGIKTLVVQEACRQLKIRGLRPDILLVREPLEMPSCSLIERKAMERYIGNQISDYRLILLGFDHWRVISIPNYQQEMIDRLGSYLHQRLWEISKKLHIQTKQVRK